MSIWNEFKIFALKGSMVDLAIGVIIGAAFGKVVSSLVSDIIMPPIGLLIGGIDFSQFALKMHLPGSTAQPVEWKYGAFLNNLIEFAIIAGAIFLVIKMINSLRKKEEKKEEPKTIECPECRIAIPVKAHKCCYCCSTLKL
jgi:large conductance mechanosensitive channel